MAQLLHFNPDRRRSGLPSDVSELVGDVTVDDVQPVRTDGTEAAGQTEQPSG